MNKNKFYKESLNYHRKFPSGKIQIYPTKDYNTQHNLSLAYSPGVAAPCYEILKNPKTVYNYTSKGNLVGVITNGTAVLGLGKIGPLASKPVMEGKAILFKIFSGIDAYDIEINEYNPKKIIQIIKAISPTFGGIILEDIKAPEAFEIENILQEELDIPIMHDDQHGTAIISGAALLNAIELVNKKIENIKMVINGAGAAAISCARIYKKLGVKNIIMCDSHGVINNKRTDINQEKKEFSVKTSMKTLSEAIKDSDIFIGLSVKNILSTDMLKSMAKNPIVFALANPDPEIEYNLAIKTRNDLIIATGRSDYPNQVNNVMGFPYIFRGALDVKAKKINEEMKLAAIKSLALLTKEPDEYINLLYNKQLSFNKEYIIPKPFDKRLITHVSKAVAKAAMDTGVARHNITNWDNYQKQLIDRIKNFR
ncbi:MAG: malate dehydrogenase [Candidatus Bostrichicola ureolyticus]|nr:MAG: malate dehydrogenase [Candidatus Bostrichicola ureolyticus]